MAVVLEMPESTDRGAPFLDAEGTFHFGVLDVSETPTKTDGNIIPNAAFSIEAEVLAGPNAHKQKKIVFFNPDPSKKGTKGYDMELKRQRFFLESVGVAPERVPGGNTYTVDLTKAKNRQFIMTLAFDTREGKEKNLQVNYADIWHVDDPTAAKCELNQAALKLLPQSLRRSPDSFKSDKAAAGSGNGNGHAAGNGSGAKQAAAAAPANINLDDI